jgi:hypothetical protein
MYHQIKYPNEEQEKLFRIINKLSRSDVPFQNYTTKVLILSDFDLCSILPDSYKTFTAHEIRVQNLTLTELVFIFILIYGSITLD